MRMKEQFVFVCVCPPVCVCAFEKGRRSKGRTFLNRGEKRRRARDDHRSSLSSISSVSFK